MAAIAEHVTFSNLPTSDATAAQYENYRKLVTRVTESFGDAIQAQRWLSSPSPDLEGRTPIAVAREDEYKMTRLEPLLVRYEHGTSFVA